MRGYELMYIYSVYYIFDSCFCDVVVYYLESECLYVDEYISELSDYIFFCKVLEEIE